MLLVLLGCGHGKILNRTSHLGPFITIPATGFTLSFKRETFLQLLLRGEWHFDGVKEFSAGLVTEDPKCPHSWISNFRVGVQPVLANYDAWWRTHLETEIGGWSVDLNPQNAPIKHA